MHTRDSDIYLHTVKIHLATFTLKQTSNHTSVWHLSLYLNNRLRNTKNYYY